MLGNYNRMLATNTGKGGKFGRAVFVMLCAAVALGVTMTVSQTAFAQQSTCNPNDGEAWDSNFQTCVGFNGVAQSGDGWPHNLIWAFWSHCIQFQCSADTVKLWETRTRAFACFRGGASVGWKIVVMGRATGYYKGWADRNNFISAALATQGGNVGWWHFPGGWYMPTSIWMRNNKDGGRMNMDIWTVCYVE